MDRNGVLSISFVASHRRLSLKVLSQPSNGTLAPQHEILAPPRSTFFLHIISNQGAMRASRSKSGSNRGGTVRFVSRGIGCNTVLRGHVVKVACTTRSRTLCMVIGAENVLYDFSIT